MYWHHLFLHFFNSKDRSTVATFSFYLVVFIYVSTAEQKDKVCVDDSPENAPFTCKRYAQLGFCKSLEENYCRKSCQKCGCDEAQALFCDVQGLMAFKNSLRTGQEHLKSWQGDNPCKWDFIVCDPENNRVGSINFAQYNIINPNNMMSGSLVPDLSKLRYLQVLGMYSVHLSGQLPAEFSVFNELGLFAMYDTIGINGTVPPQYKLLSKIEAFACDNNQLTGTIPSEFSLWTQIQIFSIIENQFSGELSPIFSTWKKLNNLSLFRNKFSGTLAPEFSEWNQLSSFDVSHNNLTAGLPQEYSTFSKISLFSAEANKLNGSLPAEYSSLILCQTFNVSRNLFTGTLPVEYSKIKLMKVFGINNNYFGGGLPKEYSTMLRLEHLIANNTNLIDCIPIEWSKQHEQAEIWLP